MTYDSTEAREGIYKEVSSERQRQLDKWGPQSWPDGTDPRNSILADTAKDLCNTAYAKGKLTWFHILKEEFYEASAEPGWTKLRQELIQTIAVAVAWIEDGDQKHAGDQQPSPCRTLRTRQRQKHAFEVMVKYGIMSREEADALLTQVSTPAHPGDSECNSVGPSA